MSQRTEPKPVLLLHRYRCKLNDIQAKADAVIRAATTNPETSKSEKKSHALSYTFPGRDIRVRHLLTYTGAPKLKKKIIR